MQEKEGMILNLGCGGRIMSGVLNIDIRPASGVDEVVDLTNLPWKWEAVDGIYMYHFLEHCREPKKILKESHRVLKKGGFLDVHVPHSSCASAVGCLHHYRTFSYNSLKDYLDPKMFRTVSQRLVWLPHWEWVPVQWLIDLSPRFCERVWGYWVGGCTEVRWKGVKV